MSLSKRDIELMLLGYKCFDNVPKVNFEKLASLAGLKNANSAQTCYSNAKRKYLGGAPATSVLASLATSSTTTLNSSSPAPASKKRKTSAKTTTSKSDKGNGRKGSTNAGKGQSAAINDDSADNADDDAEEDNEPGEDLDVSNVLTMLSEDNAASAADMQLKFDQDTHAVKQRAAASTLAVADNHPVTNNNNAGDSNVKPTELQPATVVKLEEQDDDDAKAKDLLRQAVRMAMNASRETVIPGLENAADALTSTKTVDLSREGDGEKVLGSGPAVTAVAAAKND